MALFSTSEFIETLDYKQYSMTQLLGPPLALFVVALAILGGAFLITGSPVGLGVEFVGGTEIRLAETDAVSGEIPVADAFSETPDSIRQIPSDGTYVVTFKDSGTDVAKYEAEAESAGYDIRSSSQVAASFGGDTQRLAVYGIIAAFVGMSLVVFGLFRTAIPSVAVVASATSDLVVPLAVMSLVGIDLSLGTVAALLMLIGYSVDSDILLNDYVIRRSGGFFESVYEAMETGITMTLTSLLAMVVLTAGATVFGVQLLRDIGFVLVIGLCVDLINTYMMNVSLLRWYTVERVNN